MMDFILPRKQPAPRSEKKKDLYKLLIARSDLVASSRACKLMLESVDDIGHDLYYPLFSSIIICYARPFTNNEPYGALSKKWVKFNDPRLQEVHDKIMSARHELIAHSDLKARKAFIVTPGYPVGNKNLKSGEIGTQISMYFFPIQFFNFVHETATDLLKRIGSEIERLVDDLYRGLELPSKPFGLKADEGL